jgi:6-pyruvoyltetrahydropterin/6-carboxytetrahydropterin synthase
MATKISCCKSFKFSASHRLISSNSKCENFHGHNYKVNVYITGKKRENGMLLDFFEIKKKLGEYIDSALDHSIILHDDDPLVKTFKDNTMIVYKVSFPPTVENLAEFFITEFSSVLQLEKMELEINKIELFESENSWAIAEKEKDTSWLKKIIS